MPSGELITKLEVGDFGPRYDGMESIGAPAERIVIPSDQLLMLSQVRSGHNPIHEQLKESIRQKGLWSEVSVARMSRPELEEYVTFVNGVWGSSHDPSNFEPSPDGFHYLVIAGHSRATVIQELSQEGETVLGVPCKVYDANSPESIVAHQLDENIHSRPSPEREAIAIVESYYYGLRQGLWSSRSDFIKASQNKFSKYALDRALIFTELPTDIRQFVLDGALPYSVGIELGRASRIAKNYFAERYSAEGDALSGAVHDWLQLTIARIHNSKELRRKSVRAQKFIVESARALEASLIEYREAGNQTLFELSLDEEVVPLRHELVRKIGGLGTEPLRDLAMIVNLHFGIRDGEAKASIRRQIEEVSTGVVSYLGSVGLSVEHSKAASA